jgi:DNA-binding CsgD family transcriptional regulator
LGKVGNDELLLRLVKMGGPSAADRLRTALGLTVREAEVLLWVGNGKANREIAVILAMSPRTVNKHLEQIFRKLGVENRTSAAALALRQLESNS